MIRLNAATLTRGQLIQALLDMEGSDDDTPVIGYLNTVENYVNIDDVYFDPNSVGPAITINLRDNFDTRQF